MSRRNRVPVTMGLVLVASLQAACSGDNSVSPPETYTVGGIVSGLQSGSLVLQNNGSEQLSIDSDGAFRFPSGLQTGSSYQIVVASAPAGLSCEVARGTGTVGNADVTNVQVQCEENSYTIGGVVSGFDGGELVLQNNGGDDLSINSNGSFAFPTPLVTGSDFDVRISAQPAGQVCTVSDGSGTVADADVTSVSVSCEASVYLIGGDLSGLSGGTVTLQNNGGDDLTLAADGPFQFVIPVQSGASYEVTILEIPAGQLCDVTAGSGTVGAADVSDVTVTCADAYTVGGAVTGLVSGPVVLQNNGGDDLTISTDGSFTFEALLADASAYDVTIAQQPTDRSCVVTGGAGTIDGADVGDVDVACGPLPLIDKIVFHSNRDGDYEIYVMDSDGSNVTPLTSNGANDFWPVVSPDGTEIAFWSGLDGNQEIYVMDSDGQNPRRITNNGAADRQPAWSPDGTLIAFARTITGNTDIYTVRADGTGGITRLTNNAFDDEEPAWSPDGTLIAFMTNRDGNDEIYIMEAATGANPYNLTNNPGRDGKPDWSPDGRLILFDRNNTGTQGGWQGDAEIMCIRSDGADLTRLTTDTSGFVDYQPRWSGDGTHLVYASSTGGNPELYVARVNNCSNLSNIQRVTQSGADDAAADWSPE